MASAVSSAERTQIGQISPPDTEGIKKMMEAMKATVTTLGQNFEILNEQSTKLNSLGPTMGDAMEQIEQIRSQIRSMDTRQDKRLQKLKKLMREELMDNTMQKFQPLIQDQIQAQLTRQVAEQVSAQIKVHLPVSLKDQIEESRKQLKKVSTSLEDSESRRINSALRMPRDEYEPLAVVSKADGEKSTHYPANFRSLWSYDLKQAKALAKDYDLPENGVREINLNNFMAHIGMPASACVVVMPLRR